MANYGRDIRNSVHNIEQHSRNAAHSAGQSAQSNAATNQAARSAATGVWVGAGFQAVSAFQSARAARAAEEQLAIQLVMAESQQTMAEQATWHQFSIWRQTGEGIAFMAWRGPAFRLGQYIRNRDSEWLQGWARAIGRAQLEIPNDEKHRLMRHPARLKQSGLKVAAVLSFVLAGLFTLGLLFELLSRFMLALGSDTRDFTYEECLAALNEPDNVLLSASNCEAINPYPAGPIIQQVVPLLLFLGIGIMFLFTRKIKQKAARSDRTLANEAQARIAYWHFDPLAVAPGYTGFAWYPPQTTDGYADRLMQIALYDGHGRPPTQAQLIRIDMPSIWPPSENHPEEVNQLLMRFAQERTAFR
ncbi:hypothetical protein [Cryobacterium sp. PH31-L1]|uniref:hypothetical protein n=1 Tax=Cryobacterium sp. PH31-L1 TaxID=3046199 RepID=UPI0024B9D74D|nr:hypothetical protein [Cryobacterium sp. PH31-L1]MDJ0377957.1 hypothetical protein [Cryobacterium sp. PH31-L1]